jgi:Na+-transporting NADH:ubiquinone oxidoreductase subunit NqrD
MQMMGAEEKVIVGTLYRVACLLLFVVGVVMGFPAFLVLLILPSQPSQTISVVCALVTIAALVNTVSRFKSVAWQPLVAPTWLGATGALLTYVFRNGVQF